MTDDQQWTIKRLLTWTTQFLEESGSPSPRLDAEVLLSEARECNRIALYTSYDEVPDEAVLEKFRGWIRQRAGGEPVAYLVGYREFYSLSFSVNRHVLIPRPETEMLVTLAIDFIKSLAEENQNSGHPIICDMGTGSGCIPIAVAANESTCQLTAVDICPKAIHVAKENSRSHQVGDRIDFIESNLFANVNSDRKFDCIVSNPPYIGNREKGELPRDVLEHEPHLALFSGETGLEIIEELIHQSATRLRSGGQLMFELSPMLSQAGYELISSHPDFKDSRIVHDLAQLPRVIVATRS